jgi:signal transduction histidine kinase
VDAQDTTASWAIGFAHNGFPDIVRIPKTKRERPDCRNIGSFVLNSLNSVLDTEPCDQDRLWAESERLARLCAGAQVELDEDGAISAVCAAVRNLLGADGACIVVREGELVHYAKEDTVAPLWAGQRFPITQCISGWSILHDAPAVIPDIYTDPRIPIACYEKTYVKSLAVQPIEPGNPIGAIGVYWSRFHTATAHELQLLEKLASVAATVLSHAQLRADLRKARSESHGSLATAAHELRSYSSVILGWAAILRSSSVQDTSFSHAIEVIERNVRAQGRLINDLLDLARVGAGKLKLERHQVDVRMVVREAIDAFLPVFTAKNLRISAVIDAAPLNCWGDPVRLRQVLNNLLTNACRFSFDDAEVTVTATRNAEQAQVTVADTGMGIPPEFMPHIFDAFRQAEGLEAIASDGLGLGLAIARHLVELHGGTITASSPGVNCGAVFSVKIPLLQPDRLSAV